jgi:inosine/xanthosine triphosphatase
MKVCLGGTFDTIHEGHKALLRKAFEVGDLVLIGLTADSMASRKGRVRSFEERRRHLEEYLRSQGWTDFVIEEIHDRFGPAAHLPEVDAIVVSEETEEIARKLNEARQTKGLKALRILKVALVPAEDGLPISSTRIRKGEIDAAGRVLRTLRVFVGTGNDIKVEAVARVFRRIFGRVEIRAREVDSGVSPQPYGDEAVRGAVSRARRAIGDGDFGVGIEAGLVWNEEAGDHLDVQYCAIVDRAERVTIGSGPGFVHPPAIMRMVEDGMTVGEAVEALTGIQDIGRREGAIGFLTEGRMDRTKLTEIAVLMAMVPRIRRELYL